MCRKPNYFRSIRVFDRTVKWREKNIWAKLSCTVAVVHHFSWKTACQKYFFQTLPKKNAEVVSLKNPDIDLIRSILLEYGFWISPKKRKIRFWIQESFFGFSQKNAPLVSFLLSVFLALSLHKTHLFSRKITNQILRLNYAKLICKPVRSKNKRLCRVTVNSTSIATTLFLLLKDLRCRNKSLD